MCKIAEQVAKDILSRSDVGFRKYGTTLERTDIDLSGWLKHAYEESLDESNYLKRAMKDLETAEGVQRVIDALPESERMKLKIT